MNPKPLSRTSRLIVPLGIRVSLGAYVPRSRISIFVPVRPANVSASLPPSTAPAAAPCFETDTQLYKNPKAGQRRQPGCVLFDGYIDGAARAGQGVVQVIAELQRQLVLARRQLAVELGFAIAEM